MTSRTAYHIDVGPRDNLEDAARAFRFIDIVPDFLVIQVLCACDGVGGYEYGEVASELGVSTIVEQLAAYFATRGKLYAGAVPPESALVAIRRALNRPMPRSSAALMTTAAWPAWRRRRSVRPL